MSKIKLGEIKTTAPNKLDKQKTKALTEEIRQELDELQNLLYASHQHAILIILQGMDASGKDGAIRAVMSSMNPEGVDVKAFKVPSQEEQDHDFLWRVHQHAPPKGMIMVFNRSQYEDVLVQRVHKMVDEKTVAKRMAAINDFERLLTVHGNTTILKFYLHISHEEQGKRLQERTTNPKKMWKFNEADLLESKLWKKYMKAYEDVFEQCNDVPWKIVPSDDNWYKEYVVAKTLRDTLLSLKLQYPKLKN